LEVKLEQRLGEQDAKLDRRITDLIKWMFVFWIGTVGPLAALILALAG
jgi:hypothetical protein